MRRLKINSRSILWAMSSLLAVSLAASTARDSGAPAGHHLPWREAGLTARQAAAHLLDRFAFGARPGEVDRVAAMEPDAWFEHQLAADFPEARVPAKLAPLHSLAMTSEQYLSTYPPRAVIYREAVAAGVVESKRGAGAKGVDKRAEGAGPAGAADLTGLDRPEIKEQLLEFARRKGYRTEKEAIGELVSQKVYRAVCARNQLQEVMTDFWFNHFNVALTKNRSRPFVMSYEARRDPASAGGFASFSRRLPNIPPCCSTSTTRSRRRTPGRALRWRGMSSASGTRAGCSAGFAGAVSTRACVDSTPSRKRARSPRA